MTPPRRGPSIRTRVVVLENTGRGIVIHQDHDQIDGITVEHCGPLEDERVPADIQQILEGGVEAFIRRERRYNNELNSYRAALQQGNRRDLATT